MAVTKGKLIVEGGEGYIYEVPDNPKLLMKIYKEKDLSGAPIITRELQSKLEYMKNNPPEALVSKGIVAWPVELITEDNGNLLGFIMPRMDFDEHIQRTYSYRHPTLEAGEYKRFPSVESRIKIAMNLCSALNELHIKKYVFGDLNHHNVGVNYKTGQICFMDCDSLHITTEGGSVFRTGVIMAGYLAPEIIRHCNNERSSGRGYNLDNVLLPTFTKESDLFCLSVHIFKLLMNGVNPFLGVKTDAVGSTASPFVGNEAIERNSYVFRDGNKPSAVFCLPSESLPFELSTLLNRAFLDGARVSFLRPTAADWYNALNRYLTSGLAQCSREQKHQYYNQLPECPYCVADDRHLAVQEGLPVHSFSGESVSLPVLPVNQTFAQQPIVPHPAVQQQPAVQRPIVQQQPVAQKPPIVQQRPAVQKSNPNAAKNAGSSPTIIDEIRMGTTRNLKLGRYKWRVLEKRWDAALLLTEDVIGLRQYHIVPKNTSWHSCSLRDYLNTSFFQQLPSISLSAIIETENYNPKNLWTGTNGGFSTFDDIFLLSLEEVDRYFGNSGIYHNKHITDNMFLTNRHDSDRAAIEPWWLRSPGKGKSHAAYVTVSGSVDIIGYPVNSYDVGVRPAMWLKLT